MKNILLLNPPGDKLYARDKYCTSVSKSNYYWPQIDLLCQSGFLHGKYNVSVIDAIAEKINFEECYHSIIEGNFDAIFFLTSSASWNKDFEFLEKLKRERGMTFIASGGFLLSKGEAVMQKFPFLDAILLDFTSSDILDYLENRKAKNMIYRDDGKIIYGERTSQKEFSLPIPRHELFPLKRYSFPLGKDRVYTCMITSMGCPYKCTFCIPGTIDFKLRNIDNCIEELRYICSLGVKEVLFQDSTLTVNRKHILSLCQRMIEEKLNMKWICLSRVDNVDRELLALMKRAGCHSIQFGVESGDENILKDMQKGITKKQIKNAFQWCKEVKIRTNGFFIIGLPGETAETVRKTINFAKELDCDVATFSLPMPHPGTRLGETIGNGDLVLTEKDLFDDVSIPNIETPKLSKESILELRNQAYKEFYLRPRYIFKKITQITSFHVFIMYFNALLSILKKIIRKSFNNSP